jgi:hypothetical protein
LKFQPKIEKHWIFPRCEKKARDLPEVRECMIHSSSSSNQETFRFFVNPT